MTQNRTLLKLDSTGDPSFDQILGGGIPAQSVVVIAGEPGSGKTVLTLQMLFRLAREGKKCLYFTTLSEPSIKLIRYMQQFEFFDSTLIGKLVGLADLGTALRKGADAVLNELSACIEKHRPAFVVIDSFRAITDILDPQNARMFVYDVANQTASWGATALLVGEYGSEDFSDYAEFGIADGILRLGTEKQELTSIRELEIIKLRGMNYIAGRHFLEISAKGVFVYPRVRAPRLADIARFPKTERISSGVEELDRLFSGGGIPRDSNTLLQGPAGSGKTVLGLQFLVEGARRGEPGVLFTLEELPDQIRALANGLGWEIAALERKKLLLVSYMSPVELSTDRYLQSALQTVRKQSARRAFFDSLTSMRLGVPSERRFKELVYSISKHMRAEGVTLLTSMESEQLLGSEKLSGGGVSFIADNLVQLRYLEDAGRLERAISILKSRGIPHESELRMLKIAKGGLRLVNPGKRGRRGVLTGKSVASARSKR